MKRKPLAEKVRHKVNVLHVYCLLCRITKNKKKALKVARFWGYLPVYRIIYLKAERAKRKGE